MRARAPHARAGAPALRIDVLSEAYRRGELTPVDVIDRIATALSERGEDGVWISTDLDAARTAAAALGGSPDPALPLWGIPFAVKDNIDVAGWSTTAASPDFAHAATETAGAVARILAAGAILIGKTNLDQFATGLNGTRSPYGIPRSVDDDSMISGGSSSGSAVAVAAGLVTFSLGTDTAGSGRVPAALNGIVGHKPSRGLVSTAGVVPACRSLDCVSVFALTVGDATRVVDVIAGPDPRDPWSRELPSPLPATVRDPHGLRLAIPRPQDLGLDERHGYSAAWVAALEALRGAGAHVVDVPMASFFEAGEMLYAGPWLAERAASTRRFYDPDADGADPAVRAVLAGADRITGIEVFEGVHRMQELRAHARAVLGEVDALLVPTVETTFSVEEMLADPVARNAALGRFTTFGNLLDLAAISLPVAAALPGRPFGVTVLADAGRDGALAGVAAGVERILAGAPGPLPPERPEPRLPIAVVGAHLSGMPLHGELTSRDARLRAATRTAPEYRMVALDTQPPKPGLIRVGEGGSAIEVEVYDIPMSTVGGFLAGIASPLGLGEVRLADGARVHGFLCEAIAVDGAPDISAYGGWRAYVASG